MLDFRNRTELILKYLIEEFLDKKSKKEHVLYEALYTRYKIDLPLLNTESNLSLNNKIMLIIDKIIDMLESSIEEIILTQRNQRDKVYNHLNKTYNIVLNPGDYPDDHYADNVIFTEDHHEVVWLVYTVIWLINMENENQPLATTDY